MNADKGLLEEYEADKKEVEEKQASLKRKLAELTTMKTELDGMRAQIIEQKQQNELLRKELKLKEEAAHQQQNSSLASQEGQSASNPAPRETTNSGNVNSPKISTSASASEKIRIVTTVGNRYIGNSVYVFGGGRTAYDVANGRFDCSGFVHWAFAQAGIGVGASTNSLKNEGRRVSTSEMRTGDLVFFNTYKTDGHVGIYLGGGKFIGSQNSTGVAIANMSSGYWASKFNGRVVRIIE